MTKRFSVIQICPCYVDLGNETGGVANIVRQICLQLANQRMQVLLLCGNRELGKIKAQPGRITINDFITVEVFDQRLHPLLGPTKELINRIRGLNQPCVAHVHTCFSAFTEAAMSTLHSQNIPYIFTPHGKLTYQFLKQGYWPKKIWWSIKGRAAVQNASMIGVTSVEESHQLTTLGFNRSAHIIPNGYETPPDISTSHNARIIPDPYILFLGYLDPRKQPQFLVEAYAKSKARETHLLVFVGPDSYSLQATIQEKAKELRIENRVVFYGPAYGTQKWNLLQNARCLCLPSLGEGLPVVLCEALGAQVPSIFSQECNFSELEDYGAGIMLKEFQTSLWSEAIDSICLSNNLHAQMKAATEKHRHQYTWAGIADRWQSLYHLMSH